MAPSPSRASAHLLAHCLAGLLLTQTLPCLPHGPCPPSPFPGLLAGCLARLLACSLARLPVRTGSQFAMASSSSCADGWLVGSRCHTKALSRPVADRYEGCVDRRPPFPSPPAPRLPGSPAAHAPRRPAPRRALEQAGPAGSRERFGAMSWTRAALGEEEPCLLRRPSAPVSDTQLEWQGLAGSDAGRCGPAWRASRFRGGEQSPAATADQADQGRAKAGWGGGRLSAAARLRPTASPDSAPDPAQVALHGTGAGDP